MVQAQFPEYGRLSFVANEMVAAVDEVSQLEFLEKMDVWHRAYTERCV